MNPEVQPAAAQSFAPPTREELELTARNLVSRFLGNPSGQAEDMVRELTDEELTAIGGAALDPASAKGTIKGVFTAAYERKRVAHAEEAQADKQRLRRRAIVRSVLAAQGAPADAVNHAMSILSVGEETILANLNGEHDIGEIVDAVVQRAADRQEAQQRDAKLIAESGTPVPVEAKSETPPAPVEIVATGPEEPGNTITELHVETEAAVPVDVAPAPPVAAEPAPVPASEPEPVPAKK